MTRPVNTPARDAAFGRFYARHGCAGAVTRSHVVLSAKSRLARWGAQYFSLPLDVRIKPAAIAADICRTTIEPKRSRFAIRPTVDAWNCIVVIQRDHRSGTSELRTLMPKPVTAIVAMLAPKVAAIPIITKRRFGSAR